MGQGGLTQPSPLHRSEGEGRAQQPWSLLVLLISCTEQRADLHWASAFLYPPIHSSHTTNAVASQWVRVYRQGLCWFGTKPFITLAQHP